ncbi:DUF3243 domain-containing protein [Salinithrix halophila]|uniref:DUF3243 domain-containing protein n=1 Tax=Salinithrix halophila TaxID=1485204 RepID=A0ABV8JLR4_9BACL
MSVLNNFQDWKNFLNERVQQAHAVGMNDQKIADVAQQFGDYLAQGVDPKNGEERLLKELWECADEQEQQTMASLMVKLVSGGNNQ